MTKKVQIEETSKTLKAWWLFATLLSMGSCGTGLAVGGEDGAILCVVGMAVAGVIGVGVKFLAWWNHG